MADPAEILRVGKILERLILFSGRTPRQLEQQLELSAGYFARLFNGKMELKYRHILDVLEAIDVEPETFFKIVYKDADGEELLSLIQKRALPSAPAPDPDGFLTHADLEKVVFETLAKLNLIKKPSRPRRSPPPDAPPPKRRR